MIEGENEGQREEEGRLLWTLGFHENGATVNIASA